MNEIFHMKWCYRGFVYSRIRCQSSLVQCLILIKLLMDIRIWILNEISAVSRCFGTFLIAGLFEFNVQNVYRQ
ncbi:hypothetical protein G9A89_008669 [Geosiphon pyriformis]|nr:hypothetical protein G9A89_008669 [Geosiphon pyriformis]